MANGAGRLVSDNSKGLTEGPSSWGFGHSPILLTTEEPFDPEFLQRLRYVFLCRAQKALFTIN